MPCFRSTDFAGLLVDLAVSKQNLNTMLANTDLCSDTDQLSRGQLTHIHIHLCQPKLTDDVILINFGCSSVDKCLVSQD